MSEKRESTIKLIQNSTGKILSINISQEGIEKPIYPVEPGLWWQHPASELWIQNAQRAKDSSRIIDVSPYYNMQGTLIINIRHFPKDDCTNFDVEYAGYGTDINDSGELVRDPEMLVFTDQVHEYFKNLIFIKSPLSSTDNGQITLDFKNHLDQGPMFMRLQEMGITIFYVAIKGECEYSNIIPFDFSKVRNQI